MPNTGPFVQVAAICEKVLAEADGVLSLVRIIDRIGHTVAGPDAPELMQPFAHQISIVICLKSGSARGSHTVRLDVEDPTGQTNLMQDVTVLFEGDGDRGSNIIFRDIPFVPNVPGLYWFGVTVGQNLLTRMPLRITYRRITTAGGQIPGPDAAS